MKRLIYYMVLLVLLPGYTSCIRDELLPCPPLSIRFAVADKNYDNIAAIAALGLDTVRPAGLPFGSYVGTLYYQLQDCATGETVVLQRLHRVSGTDTLATCRDIPAELPFGRYAITIWGNLPEALTAADTFDPATLRLHPEAIEGVDVYLATDTVDYDYDRADFTIGLHRVKGKLVVQARQLPDSVRWSDKTVDNISAGVTATFDYSGATEVYTERAWAQADSVVSHTYLAPSAGGEPSAVEVHFYDDPARAEPVLTPRTAEVQLRRNEVAVVRYDYLRELGEFRVYVLVGEAWEEVHGMGLD